MEGVPAIYLGRRVNKEHFRAFIYASDGTKKLVHSWDEFQKHMETGIWFAHKKDIPKIEPEKPKKSKKSGAKVTFEIVENPLKQNESDVKKDDFLSDAREE